jgi:hypothetical protein
MHKCSNDSGGSGPPLKDNHLSDEQLLLALDGELSGCWSKRVEIHLKACWSCRGRSREIEQAIEDVVKYRNRLLEANPDIPSSSRTMFVARLEQLARSLARPPLAVRLSCLLRTSCASFQDLAPQLRKVGIVSMAFLLVWLSSQWRVREVAAPSAVPARPENSISEFLEYAEAAETQALRGVVRPVVYQKLRIQTGNLDVTRTIYRDLSGKRQTDQVAINRNRAEAETVEDSTGQDIQKPNERFVERDLEQVFKDARLDWEAPLSPASYRSWRAGLSEKRDQISDISSELITLRTTTLQAPIATASFTIRKTDFHPVAGDFRLLDARRIEVKELDWRVIPLEVVDPAIFVVEPGPIPVTPRPIEVSAGPTETELAEAELQARVALHVARADLGEELEIGRSQRSVLVRGLLANLERKNELLEALSGIPSLDLQLQTLDDPSRFHSSASGQAIPEMADQGVYSSARSTSNLKESEDQDGGGIAVSVEEAKNRGFSLDERLQDRFPRVEERTAFSNQVIDLAQTALSQGWALRRLKDRYTPEEMGRLSQGSKQALGLLIHDNVSALRRPLNEIRQMIPIVASLEPGSSMQSDDNGDVSRSRLSSNWRDAVGEIFQAVQQMDSNVAALFAESEPVMLDQEARLRELQSGLIRLEAYLQFLNRDVSSVLLN